MMSITEKLYKSAICLDGYTSVAYESDVATLVRQLEARCAELGLTLSRWQANSRHGGHVKRITYMAHRGPRADRSDQQTDVVDWALLTQAEGTTKRSEAYRVLSAMLQCLK